ncbi:MAG: hypothetical protein ACOVO3_08130, partial [Fluviicola sp.]
MLKAHCKALKLARFLEKKYPRLSQTICYSYWGDTAATSLAYLKKRQPEILTVSRFHGWDLYEERAPEQYLPLRKFTESGLDVLSLISNHGLSYLRAKNSFIPNHRYRVAYLGVSKAKIIPEFIPSSSIRLVSVVNTHEVKRLDRLIRVIHTLSERIEVDWTIVGVPSDFIMYWYATLQLKPIKKLTSFGV